MERLALAVLRRPTLDLVSALEWVLAVAAEVEEAMTDQPYVWRIGDVFTNGAHHWKVDAIHGEKAVLRSCGSSWATTIPLTFDEWREGGRWRLEESQP